MFFVASADQGAASVLTSPALHLCQALGMDAQKQHAELARVTFSVVIPAFNAARFLEETLVSVAAANSRDRLDQVIVVDDASNDSTAAVAQSMLQALQLPGMVLRNVNNLGVGLTRQRGFAQVTSSLIACVDADDVCRPGRFSDALALLDRMPALQMVGGDLQLFHDPACPHADDPMLRLTGQRVRLPVHGEDIAAALVFYCPLYAGASVFRTSLLQKVASPEHCIGEDWLFVHRVVQAFGPQAVANTGTVLAGYRRHMGQLTHNAFIDNQSVLAVWKEVLQTALGIRVDPAALALHARYCPPQPPPVEYSERRRWLAWCDRLLHAAIAVDYVPDAMARLLRRLHQSQSQTSKVSLSCALD